MQPDVTIQGKDINSYIKPCIYVWMRGDQCLYVGASVHGLGRAIYKHHVINQREHIQDGDRLELYYVRPSEVGKMEAALISKNRPILNRTPY